MSRLKPITITAHWIAFADELPLDKKRVLVKSDTLESIRVRRKGNDYYFKGERLERFGFKHWEKYI